MGNSTTINLHNVASLLENKQVENSMNFTFYIPKTRTEKHTFINNLNKCFKSLWERMDQVTT